LACGGPIINILSKMIASLHDENNHIHPFLVFIDKVETSIQRRGAPKWPKAPFLVVETTKRL